MAKMNWSNQNLNNYQRAYNPYKTQDNWDTKYYQESTITRKQIAIMYKIVDSYDSTEWKKDFVKSCISQRNLSSKQKNLLNRIYVRVLRNNKH